MSTMQRSRTGVARSVLNGTEEVISHRGSSQFGGVTGSSACGLAALNFARVIFREAQGREHDEELIRTVIRRQTVQDITSICAGWSSDSHLDVEDIYRIPVFEKTLKLVNTKFGCPGLDEFENLLQELQGIGSECAVIITRPPEIIACLKITVCGKDVFAIFDSHSRPSYPEGSGLILSTSVHGTATRLASILPVDSQLLNRSDMQWQVQLLANYSGHVFVPRESTDSSADLMSIVIESSLIILALRAEAFDLRFRNSALASEMERLQIDMEAMSSHRCNRTSPQAHGQNSNGFGRDSPGSARNVIATAGPSRKNRQKRRSATSDRYRIDERPWSSVVKSPAGEDDDLRLAEQMQFDADRQSAEIASLNQKKYDEEDLHLRTQREELMKCEQCQFQCGVCFEEQPEDFVARLEPCGHKFCRDCVKGHVISKLGEHRFPVICPSCMTEQDKGNLGVVSNTVAQQIGLTEAEFETWVELELVEFSVLLHCRKCKQSAYVDRQDLEDATTLACPFPECNHIWCKACQQSIAMDGPRHSCDGSSELASLMKEKGWKYCPGCKTPFIKEAGCNHMTCMSSGCNTHFCYVCGNAIIRSALRREVQAATSAHYRTCNLFEDVADRGVPP